MTSKTTHYSTQEGTVLFAAIQEQFATNLKRKQIKTGKATEESHLYSVRIKLNSSDPAIETIRNVNEAKVDTKANAKLQATEPNSTIINFSSNYLPKVVDVSGNELTGDLIPVFDGRSDSATAVVTFSVIDYGKSSIVRLTGIRFLSLEQAPKEETVQPMSVTLDMLKNIGTS